MVVRWLGASPLEMEATFRRIMGYQDLWILEGKLNKPAEASGIAKHEQIA